MDWTKIKEALGLPADTADEKVFEAASARLLANQEETEKAKEELAKFSTALSKGGFKIEGDTVVKLETTPPPAANETPEMKKLREELAAVTKSNGKAKLSAAVDLAEKYIGEGKIAPSDEARTALGKLFSAADDQAKHLALAKDSDDIVEHTLDVVGNLKTVLDAVPTITGDRLSQLSAGETDAAKKKAKERTELAKNVRQMVQPRKEAAAAS